MNIATKTLIVGGLMAAAAGATPAFAIPSSGIGFSESFASAGGIDAADYTPHNSSFQPSLFSATSLNSGDGYTIASLVGPAGANGETIYFTSQNFALTQTAQFDSQHTIGTVNISTFQVNWGASAPDNYFFTPSSGTYAASTGNGSSQVAVFLTGTFSDSLGIYATQTASFTETYSQSGASAISFGANFSTSPNPVPEPISMSILGLGLLGLAAVKMRRA